MSDALLEVASERRLGHVLQRLAEAARVLAQADYAAVGLPAQDDHEAFGAFIHSGMDEALVAELGELPRRHGVLGAMLTATTPVRTDDLQQDPRFLGWWPPAHPDMHTFLGVPIVDRGDVIGAFYLTEKVGGGPFTDADQRLIEVLAAHAGVAISNARLFDASRELAIAEERERLARELHDALSQTLFSVSLLAQAAGDALATEPDRAREQLAELADLAREARAEVRALVQGMRPADLASDGLAGALERHLALLRRVHGVGLELVDEGWDADVDEQCAHQVFRIVQEAVSNALRHAAASRVAVRLRDRVVEVVDDGKGFDPEAAAVRGRHLGLSWMRQRAEAAGGRLTIDAAPGRGTRILLELRRG